MATNNSRILTFAVAVVNALLEPETFAEKILVPVLTHIAKAAFEALWPKLRALLKKAAKRLKKLYAQLVSNRRKGKHAKPSEKARVSKIKKQKGSEKDAKNRIQSQFVP